MFQEMFPEMRDKILFSTTLGNTQNMVNLDLRMWFLKREKERNERK